MPVHENSYVAGDTTDLATDRAMVEVAGTDVVAQPTLVDVGGTSEGFTPIGGKPALGVPTSISASDKAATSGTITVTYTEASGGASVDILVVDSAGEFVSRTEDAASPVDISGLTNDEQHTVYVRTVASDGRYSRFAAGVTVTPTAT